MTPLSIIITLSTLCVILFAGFVAALVIAIYASSGKYKISRDYSLGSPFSRVPFHVPRGSTAVLQESGSWDIQKNDVVFLGKSTIPRTIMQTYFTRSLQEGMSKAVNTWFEKNKGYEFMFFDDISARKFIYENCDQEVLRAFDALKPGAYKADIFRLAYLKVKGGYYADASMIALKSLEDLLLEVGDKVDLIIACDKRGGPHMIHQAFIGATKNNPVICQALSDAVYNVISRNPTECYLSLTGPGAFGKSLNKYLKKDLIVSISPGSIETENCRIFLGNFADEKVSFNKVDFIASKYENWMSERPFQSHYGELWNNGDIFHLEIRHSNPTETELECASNKSKKPNSIPDIMYYGTETTFGDENTLRSFNSWVRMNPKMLHVRHESSEMLEFVNKHAPDALNTYIQQETFEQQKYIWQLCVLRKTGGHCVNLDTSLAGETLSQDCTNPQKHISAELGSQIILDRLKLECI